MSTSGVGRPANRARVRGRATRRAHLGRLRPPARRLRRRWQGQVNGIHGRGAWEVAFRWSYVDLRDPTKLNGYYLPGSSSVGAGLLNDTTCGLTWFLNQHTKMQFNWIHALACPSDQTIYAADMNNWRIQRLTLK